MSGFWTSLLRLNCELSLWAEEGELGKEKAICHQGKQYLVKIPEEMRGKTTLRLRGLGKTRLGKTGDLLLHVWLNKGEDVRKRLWLSETSARNGAEKELFTGEKKIAVVIPPGSHHGLTLRLGGLGGWPSFGRGAPALKRVKRGSLLVKLAVYPDSITPKYRPFDTLSTEHMALEGWVYRKFDEVIHKLGDSSPPVNPIQADAIADLFNEEGWTSIFDALVHHLSLPRTKVVLESSPFASTPGNCERTPIIRSNKVEGYNYRITINGQFLDHPFCIAAILAHELCHVLYSERIDDASKSQGYPFKTEEATLEEERTVDLLVFMFKMGEFQLRVARDRRLTLGYFNQETFERMQVIVSKKLGSS